MYERKYFSNQSRFNFYKIALFNQDGKEIFKENISHSTEELSQFRYLLEQSPVRKKIISNILKKKNIDFDYLKAVIERGGVLKSLEAGTYKVNHKLIDDLKRFSY